MKSTELQLAEALENGKVSAATITTLEAQVAAFKAAASVSAKAAAKSELSKLMAEAKLPEPAQTRLQEHFATAETVEGMKEAVAKESDYIKSLKGSTTKHNGVGDNGQITESEVTNQKKALVEKLKSQGMSEADAKGIAGL